jgi:tetratricopeptide (TPR) repeat protein
MRRIPEAISHISTAFDLEPFNVLTNVAVGWGYYCGREYARAIAQFEKTLLLEESYGVAHLWMSWAYCQLGAFDEALRHAEAPQALSVARVEAESAQAIVHAAAGRPERARTILQSLQWMTRDRFVQPYELATIHIALGDVEPALGVIEEAYTMRSHRLAYAQVDPKLDPLRNEPGFAALLKRMEFPE